VGGEVGVGEGVTVGVGVGVAVAVGTGSGFVVAVGAGVAGVSLGASTGSWVCVEGVTELEFEESLVPLQADSPIDIERKILAETSLGFDKHMLNLLVVADLGCFLKIRRGTQEGVGGLR
jgi:hypothetical protein